MKDVKSSIWTELKTGKAINPYRRKLQDSYINIMTKKLQPTAQLSAELIKVGLRPILVPTDLQAIVKQNLINIRIELRKSIPLFSDAMSKMHLKLMLFKLNEVLGDNKKNI